MKAGEFKAIERYMLECMKDSAHDAMHIYRVLYAALEIAETEPGADTGLLIAACLLHDIGREEQSKKPGLCHAETGGDMACNFLLGQGWEPARAAHVRECIKTHRYRQNHRPESLEAKILFDADKLDMSGAIGIARSPIYQGHTSEPLYILDENGAVVTQSGGSERSSFFQEYDYKLKNLYGAFYTNHAKKIAARRQKAAADFHAGLLGEVRECHRSGAKALERYLEQLFI